MLNVTEYLLTCLNEECSEIIKITDKALRFGLKDHDHTREYVVTNLEELAEEIIDFTGVVKKMIQHGIFNIEDVVNVDKADQKMFKIERFMKYSRANGCLEPEE